LPALARCSRGPCSSYPRGYGDDECARARTCMCVWSVSEFWVAAAGGRLFRVIHCFCPCPATSSSAYRRCTPRRLQSVRYESCPRASCRSCERMRLRTLQSSWMVRVSRFNRCLRVDALCRRGLYACARTPRVRLHAILLPSVSVPCAVCGLPVLLRLSL